MKSRWLFTLTIILGLTLFSSLAIPVAAATPTVKLVLGGSGTTGWNIGEIKPGDSGTQPITIMNSGTDTGNLNIWVSNVINTEGTNPKYEPSSGIGDLGNFITFSVISSRISSNIAMPSRVNDLPQSASDSHYIEVLSLAADETININWDWNLPAGTGNIIQGDSLSFTINYALDDIPPSSPVPPTPPSQTEVTGVGITMTVSSGISIGSTRSCTVAVTNTEATTLNDVTVTDYLPGILSCQGAVPTGTIVGNQTTWNLGTLNTGETKEIIAILMGVKAGIAVNTAAVTTLEGASASTSVDIMVISTSVPSPPLPPAQVQSQVSPANFEVRNLTVSPIQAKPGESISINYEVINTGGQSGEFTLITNITNLSQTNQLIKLDGGQTQTNNLTFYPSNPGTYQVNIGGANATFTIETLPQTLHILSGTQKVIRDLSIPAILVIIGGEGALVYYIAILMMRRRRTKHQRRVAELASAIAKEMNLSKKMVKMLLIFGIIRDPALAELPYPVAKTAIQYNKRLNGSGYPQKLAGDDILLEARIMAIADLVETMSSPRPNDPAMSLEKVLEEIKQSSSNLYDAEVVKALVRLVNQGNFKFRTIYN